VAGCVRERMRTTQSLRPGIRSRVDSEENARRAVFGQTGALTGTLRTASQAASRLPVGGRRLREVVFLKRRQLREERVGENGLNRGRMRPRFRSGVGEPETEMLQNSPDHRWILDGGNDPHGMLASGATPSPSIGQDGLPEALLLWVRGGIINPLAQKKMG